MVTKLEKGIKHMKILFSLTFTAALLLLLGCDSKMTTDVSAVSSEAKEVIIIGDQSMAWSSNTIDTEELQTVLVFDIDDTSAVASR